MNTHELKPYQLYLDGKLSQAQLREELKELSDEDFKDMLEGLEIMENGNSFLNAMDKLENRVDERIGQLTDSSSESKVKELNQNRSSSFDLRWLAAAAILFLLGTLVFRTMNTSSSTDKLFATYFEPLEHKDPIVRGDENVTLEAKAHAAYAAGDYETAVEYYEELSHTESWEIKNALFLGIAYISINSEQKAISTFNNLPNDLGAYKDEVTWYLALAHLKNNDLVSTRLLLEKLNVHGNYYERQASAILEKLK